MAVELALHVQRKFAVGNDASTYLFDLAGNTAGTVIAASASNHSIKIYSATDLSILAELKGHKERISGIKFSSRNDDILYSCSMDGAFCQWSISSGKRVILYNAGKNLPLTSFDVNCTETLACLGTEFIDHEAKLLFIDLTTAGSGRLVATYDNVHNDDITCIHFHPITPTALLSGSTDGTVSHIDLSSAPDSNEDDCLLLTLNTESSVASIGFFGPVSQYIYATTHIESLYVWEINEGTQLVQLNDVRQTTRNSPIPVQIDYIVDVVYHASSQRLFLVAGTFDGNIVMLHINRDSLDLVATMPKAHNEMVRCSFWNTGVDHVFTGDEDAVLCKWGPPLPPAPVDSNPEADHKIKTVTDSRGAQKRVAPY
ncbi:hypothetical protein SARC_11895 [Sphaeroforma arctica JP610]|uniref:Uncharacterized protein n=1 Tax=Sphaeroforma arctica JP610 TaxID=667725 RepID=A0A0L0FFS3_9EUKA|nr:hypothetical protein SARC_11895 [Sphaeroforma arctica JP610]KNC75585.1 hypothetical protein SARC_11895 [Sphaeroforma arctica JP610]|eukprot:XP_014149487.1 hypothetical protein SARC_11895 [Sphaeroforma arctica JP610]